MKIVAATGRSAYRIVRWPLVYARFKIRERRLLREIVPRRWLSPGEVLTRDLENYEEQADYKLGLKFIEDFAKARDEIQSRVNKQIALSAVIFVFLAASYFGLKFGVSVGGITISDAPGVAEGLLLFSNLMSCYALILQGNAYLLDAAIKHAIDRSIPEELEAIYRVRYFPHEYVGSYTSFNLPHIIPNALSRGIERAARRLFLVLICVVLLSFSACNLALLLHFLWFNPKFGWISYLLLGFILLSGISAMLYFVVTRFRLPYLDYTVNHELELLKQTNPRLHEQRLHEIYGPLNAERRRMQEEGYLK